MPNRAEQFGSVESNASGKTGTGIAGKSSKSPWPLIQLHEERFGREAPQAPMPAGGAQRVAALSALQTAAALSERTSEPRRATCRRVGSTIRTRSLCRGFVDPGGGG
jgi:hypothetical protein